MDDKKRHYHNGQWVNEGELAISPLDLAVLRGFGVFDFMTATNGVIFHLHDHLKRYEESARRMGIPLPVTDPELEQIIHEGIQLNNDRPDLFIRLILTGGVSRDFITPGEPAFMVLFHPAHRPAPELYTAGASLISYPYQREMAEVKSLSYAMAVIAIRKARENKAIEAIYIDQQTGQVFEGTGSNIFGVTGGILFTPNEGILRGVMRGTVLELAQKLRIPADERLVTYDELARADEVFITSSIKRIMPIRQFDSMKIRNSNGTVTQQLMSELGKLIQ